MRNKVVLEYSVWRAAYTIIVPFLAFALILLYVMSNQEFVASRLTTKPLAVPVLLLSFLIWIIACLPNAFKIIWHDWRSISFINGRVTLKTRTQEFDLGTLMNVQPSKSIFRYARFRIGTEKLSEFNVVTAFLRDRQDASAKKLMEELAVAQIA
jgi:hypothetical protein